MSQKTKLTKIAAIGNFQHNILHMNPQIQIVGKMKKSMNRDTCFLLSMISNLINIMI